jgi:hypothetical protein
MSRPSKTLSAVAAAVMVAGLGLTASASGAAPIGTRAQLPLLGPFDFTAATQSFTSSTHKHLRVGLAATNAPDPAKELEPSSMTITVTRRHAAESHNWVFELPRDSDLSYDVTAGTGVLKTGSAIKPFGALSLALTAVGRAKSVGCGRTRADHQPVRVTGTMSFDTRSKGKTRWGAVGGRHRMTFTGRSIVTIFHPADKLCGSFLPPCVTTMSWLAHKTTPGNTIGNDEVILQEFASTVGSRTTYTISGERIRHLPRPDKAVRTDTTTLTVPRSRFSFPASSASVKVFRHAPAMTGSATLSSVTMTESVGLACGTFPELSTTTMWTASYRNATHPLALHEQIEGTYRLPNHVTSAEITRVVPNT